MASNTQIFIVLVIGWVAIFALGWMVGNLHTNSKHRPIKHYKVKIFKIRYYNYSKHKKNNSKFEYGR